MENQVTRKVKLFVTTKQTCEYMKTIPRAAATIFEFKFATYNSVLKSD